MARPLGNRVGEKHITNEGYEIEIIECISSRICTVKFKNGVIIRNRQYAEIKDGRVKNPYHKSKFGIGYIGEGKYKPWNTVKQENHRYYTTWNGMLERCYSKRSLVKHPTYKDVTVCEEWHNFQVFAEWYENSHINSWQLDKDILVKGNKIYSPETCCFVPHEINTLFIKQNNNRGKYPIGVHKANTKFKATMNVNGKVVRLGTFNTPEEAFQAYKIAKEQYIKEIADKWRGQIPKRIYEAMYNHTIKITD